MQDILGKHGSVLLNRKPPLVVLLRDCSHSMNGEKELAAKALSFFGEWWASCNLMNPHFQYIVADSESFNSLSRDKFYIESMRGAGTVHASTLERLHECLRAAEKIASEIFIFHCSDGNDFFPGRVRVILEEILRIPKIAQYMYYEVFPEEPRGELTTLYSVFSDMPQVFLNLQLASLDRNRVLADLEPNGAISFALKHLKLGKEPPIFRAANLY